MGEDPFMVLGTQTLQRCPRVSARACIRRGGVVLLSKYEDDRGVWYVMPGGGQQAGETLSECLVREVREELGVVVEVGALMCVREIIAQRHVDTNLPKGFHQVELFFACALRPGDQPGLGSTPDPGQIGFEWVAVDELETCRFFPLGLAARLARADLRGEYIGEVR